MVESHTKQNTQGQSEARNSNTGHGKTLRHHSGYLYEIAPEHPQADVNGRVLQHRLAMERHLGRALLPTEVVHHVNHKKDDNRIENLELCESIVAHMKRHRKRDDPETVAAVLRGAADKNASVADMPVSKQLVAAICRKHGVSWTPSDETHLTREQVRIAALRFPKIQDAAKSLGVSNSHLYLNHSDLFQKRPPPGFLDAHREAICKKAMTHSTNQIAREYGTTRTTILQALIRWQVSGGLPIELVERLNADRRRKKKLQRMA